MDRMLTQTVDGYIFSSKQNGLHCLLSIKNSFLRYFFIKAKCNILWTKDHFS